MVNVAKMVNMVVMTGEEAITFGAHAGHIAAEMAKVVGGGRTKLGQEGPELTKAFNVLELARELVRRQVMR